MFVKAQEKIMAKLEEIRAVPQQERSLSFLRTLSVARCEPR